MMPTGSKRVTQGAMLSIPHMIVIFVVVLVVFGPKKLPELARGLGKLMAEFRKASTDFRTAFEQEMRDLERQATQVERKKQAEAAAAKAAAAEQPATLGTPAGTETAPSEPLPVAPEIAPDASVAEGPVISPVPEAVPRAAEEVLPAASTNGDGSSQATGHSANHRAEPRGSEDLAHDIQR
ncbi:MAG: hypothetical protein C5B56_11010 [Proteobacteria bacterium]|nr:MAG: hypothetical protein C5B56_11010 [Pseudomonadota bacterium]